MFYLVILLNEILISEAKKLAGNSCFCSISHKKFLMAFRSGGGEFMFLWKKNRKQLCKNNKIMAQIFHREFLRAIRVKLLWRR